MTEEFCKKTGLTTAQIEGKLILCYLDLSRVTTLPEGVTLDMVSAGDTAKAASSTITIRSRCHEAGGDWRPEPGSPKYMRDLMVAKRRAAKQTQSKTKAKRGDFITGPGGGKSFF